MIISKTTGVTSSVDKNKTGELSATSSYTIQCLTCGKVFHTQENRLPNHDCSGVPPKYLVSEPYFVIPDKPWSGNWSAERVASNPFTGNDVDSVPALMSPSDRCWWQCKTCGVLFESYTCPPSEHFCWKEHATGVAFNPLTGKKDKIASVLQMLASQENCDGEPYDQMQAAAEYIRKLESQVDVLFKLARLVRNTDGLFPSTWGDAAGKLLIKVKASDEERYQREVMEK